MDKSIKLFLVEHFVKRFEWKGRSNGGGLMAFESFFLRALMEGWLG